MDKKQKYEDLEEKNRNLEKLLQAKEEKEIKLLKRIGELEKTEKYFNAFAQNTEDYVLICDSEGVSLAFNESYKKKGEELLNIEIKPGLKPHKLSGRPEVIEYWDTLQNRVINGERFTAEFHDKENDQYFETIFCPIKEDGEVTGFTEITRNITEHKRIAGALKESNSFNSSLLDNSPSAILVYRPDTTIIYVNPLFEKLTGFTGKEVRGLKAPYPWWIDEPEYGSVEKRKKDILEGVHRAERRYRKKNGEYSWVEINIKPIYHDEKLSYVLSMWVDISDRKTAEQEKKSLRENLIRSQKMESLGLLAGGVAHDLNNVLAGIVSYPELLLMELPEDSTLRKPIRIIEESGQRAVAIVQDLLTIARGIVSAKEPLNLNDIISDYLQSPEFKKLEQYHPEVSIETDLDSTLLNVIGSHIHIRKAVMNLVSNASEAIENRGNISVSTMNRYVDRPLKLYDDVKVGEYAVISVSDDGMGISSVDIDRIFEPFYSKKVMGRSGTGLGLAVVWNVVKEHNGYINVTSGKDGTTFELYFPATRKKVLDKTLSIPIEKIKGKGEKILVVDDMNSQREIICNILRKLDYSASPVSGGEEAVKFIKENSVDLILLDMIMEPGINGRETYERITKIKPGQKALIISGFAETSEVEATQKLGAGQFVKKPLTLQRIGLAIKEELEKS